MIVDAHAHAFPFLGEAGVFASAAEHLRYLQRHMSTHSQGCRRARDNAPASGSMLWDGKRPDLGALPDVGFRVGKFGRLEWEKDGESYYIQYLPPHLEETAASPERMLAQMQYVGVDQALLQAGRVYSSTHEYLSDVVRRWPDRFRGCLQVNENQAHTDEQIAILRRAVEELGLTALYFSNDSFVDSDYTNHFDDAKYGPFWETVASLGVPVVWEIQFPLRRTHAAYMAEALRLQRHMRRLPTTQHVLCESLPASAFDGGRIPDELWAVLSEPNLTVEILFPLLHGSRSEYPYAEAQAIVRDLYERLGGSKLMWGTDMPNVERACTYRQSIDYLRKHCTFIEAADMDMILGANAHRIYFEGVGASVGGSG
jgi:predicted TIM-barrel fold metal-dependent hydrolase